MADHTSLLGKMLVGVFILEVIGIIFALTIGTSPNGSSSQFTDSTSGFYTFTSLINGTTSNIATAFSGCSFSTLSCSKPLTQLVYADQGWFLSGVANAILWIGNILITFVDLIINIIWFVINILGLILLMIGMFGYVFVIFLPSIMVSIGPVGYLLTMGYALIISIVGYKYGHIILDLVSVMIAALQKVI